MLPRARPSLATDFALTRFAGPAWETQIPAEFINRCDLFFKSASEQHPARRWEYSLALYALSIWKAAGFRTRFDGWKYLDVGGAGSPLRNMLAGPAVRALVVDPALSSEVEGWRGTVETVPFAAGYFDALFSISVLEHVPDVDGFLDACGRLLAPGGLLFLTVDAWDPPVDFAKDTAHFHWMRERIFSKGMILGLLEGMQRRGFEPLGGVDLEYKGNTVYDYTFASLAMVKGD